MFFFFYFCCLRCTSCALTPGVYDLPTWAGHNIESMTQWQNIIYSVIQSHFEQLFISFWNFSTTSTSSLAHRGRVLLRPTCSGRFWCETKPLWETVDVLLDSAWCCSVLRQRASFWLLTKKTNMRCVHEGLHFWWDARNGGTGQVLFWNADLTLCLSAGPRQQGLNQGHSSEVGGPLSSHTWPPK